nr:MBL fold metallo-hydrolase [Lachnospiraceae bacterium]
PFTNKRLLKKGNDGFERDDFAHEHFLVINDGEKKILMSGCAHNGILSILDAFIEKYGKEPDIVISGFHLKLKRDYREHEMQEITDIAKELNRYQTKFYTCHCTGVPAFEAMKEIMGDRLKYVHSGDLITLDQMIF